MTSRVDSFLGASLVFARDAQTYLLSLLGEAPTPEIYPRARDALSTSLAGIDRARLPTRRFLVGDGVTLADIGFVAELGLFLNERTRTRALAARGLLPILEPRLNDSAFARAVAHFKRLREHPAFAPDMRPYLEKIEKTAARAIG